MGDITLQTTCVIRNSFLLPDGTSRIQYDIPNTVIQTIIDKAVADKDWGTLYLLFLGGGGQRQFKKGSGGLAMGCDASSVPLKEIISCDFPDLKTFISILLGHKATDNPQKGTKSALDVAIELEKFAVASVLMDSSITSGDGFNAAFSQQHPKVKGQTTYVTNDVFQNFILVMYKTLLS